MLHKIVFIYALMRKIKVAMLSVNMSDVEHMTFVFDRADWFLLDSRAVRHVAIGLFCLGVSVYLAGRNKRVILDFLFKNMLHNLYSTCI